MDRGLHFLCLYNTRLPLELVRRQRATLVSGTLAALTKTPWGYGLKNSPYSHDIQFSNTDLYYDRLVGAVSGITRMWVNGNYYYPGAFGMDGASWDRNIPISFSCNQYYNGTTGIMPGITRCSTSGVRVWNMTANASDAIQNATWFTCGFHTGPLMQDQPTFIYENVRSLGATTNYTDSGTPAGIGNAVKVGQSGHGDSIIDYTVIFRTRLTDEELRGLMAQPFGELVEPDTEKSYMFVSAAPPTRAPSNMLLGVGD